jgi:hypothetical protein
MDHVVYIDAKEKDLQKLLNGTKRMIIRGATGRKLPYGRVHAGDGLFFIQNDGSGLVQAAATVKQVTNSDQLSKEESVLMVEKYMSELQLTPRQVKRWAGKRYLVLIRIENAVLVEPFIIDRSEYGNMDDWLPVGDIEQVKIEDITATPR